MASSRTEAPSLSEPWIGRAAARLSTAANAVALAALPPLMLLTMLDVLGRQFLGRPIKGVVEYSEFLLVLAVWFAVAETSIGGGHIRMELFVDKTGPRARAAAALAGASLGLVVALFVARGAAALTVASWKFDLLSDVAKLPLWIPQGAMTVGATVLAVQLLAEIVMSVARLSGRAPLER